MCAFTRTVMCMKAHDLLTASGARLRLKTEAFDRLAREALGADASDSKIAAHLGVDKSSLSQFRNGHRYASLRFAERTCAAFNAVADDLFEVVQVREGAA